MASEDQMLLPALNGTLIGPNLCTPSICSMEYAQIDYVPILGGNLFYLIVFALLLVAQLGLGIFYKTWGFLGGMFG
ncbi:hypothetical protein LTS18_013938, partial [Coniosporium uncinatum]